MKPIEKKTQIKTTKTDPYLIHLIDRIVFTIKNEDQMHVGIIHAKWESS